VGVNKQKGISALVIILIIAGVVIVAGGGILVYQHYYSNPKSAVCTPNWKCGWGPCIIPPCAPGSNSSACTNGSQSQIVVDSNNCGLPSSSAKIACPALARICTPSTQPSITSISPNPAKIGSAITAVGTNLNGFEGDKNLWIENSAGQKGIIYGARDDSTATIKFTLAGSYCTADTSYSGLPCPSSINIISGTYNIYAVTPSGTSNKVSFTVSSTAAQPSITVISPNGGETWQTGSTQMIKWNFQWSSKMNVDPVADIHLEVFDKSSGQSLGYSFPIGSVSIKKSTALESYSYNWAIPAILSTYSRSENFYNSNHSYKIYIETTTITSEHGTPDYVSDYSNALFNIVSQ